MKPSILSELIFGIPKIELPEMMLNTITTQNLSIKEAYFAQSTQNCL